jgi:hypothetical protein
VGVLVVTNVVVVVVVVVTGLALGLLAAVLRRNLL